MCGSAFNREIICDEWVGWEVGIICRISCCGVCCCGGGALPLWNTYPGGGDTPSTEASPFLTAALNAGSVFCRNGKRCGCACDLSTDWRFVVNSSAGVSMYITP